MQRIFVIIAAFFIVGVFPQFSNATTIEIELIDSGYSFIISGSRWSSDVPDWWPEYYEVAGSANTPPYGRFYYSDPFFGVVGGVFVDQFYFCAYVFMPQGYNKGGVFSVYWTFTPLQDVAQLEFVTGYLLGSGLNKVITLEDLTNGLTIFSGGDPTNFGGPFSVDSDLLTGHTYALSFSGYLDYCEDGDAAEIYWDNVRAVPEPSTMLLLVSGIIGLWGFRRKFKK